MDGPFKNSQLSNQWKQFGKDLVSDAMGLKDRTNQACHSLLSDIGMREFSALLNELYVCASRHKMDPNPVPSVESVFRQHGNSPRADILKRNLFTEIRNGANPGLPIDQALRSAVGELIEITKRRLDTECIKARDIGDMNQENFHKGLQRSRETFDAIDQTKICTALSSGDLRAFRKATQEKSGLDEGPDE